jgi:hypothetical protein
MKNNVFPISILILFSVLISACKGDKGDVGPAGPSSSSVFIGGDDQIINLSPQVAISRKISITVEESGTILFQASGFFAWDNNIRSYYDGRASLSLNDSTMDFQYITVWANDSAAFSSNPYVVTRGMTVKSPGTYTVYLIGDSPSGDGVEMVGNNASAIFTPQ